MQDDDIQRRSICSLQKRRDSLAIDVPAYERAYITYFSLKYIIVDHCIVKTDII